MNSSAQIKGDQASIDNAQTQLSYTTIRSPLTGKTGFRLVDAGNIVHAADTTGIVTIVQLQPISVVFTAPEEDVPQINKALAAGAVPVTALSSDGLKTLSQGHLAVVNDAIDQASGAIQHEGDVRECGRRPVARPVGLDPPAGRHAEASHRRARRRRRTRPERPLRLRRRQRQQGRDTRHHGRPRRRWTIGRPEGSVARRKRGHGGPIPIGSRLFGPVERGEFRAAARDGARRTPPAKAP